MEQNQNYQNQQPPYHGQEPLPNATLVLVFGILSIIVCQPLGIVALVMGNSSINQYQANPGRYSEGSYNNVKAGRICGIVGIALMLIWIVLMLAGVSFFSFWGTRNFKMD